MSDPHPTHTADPARCPLCGAPNRCVRAAGEDRPCWCKEEVFGPELLARVRAVPACVCKRCLERERG